jgi:hypothetical protein
MIESPSMRGCEQMAACRRRGENQVQESEAQTAWETAARCAALAQETADPHEREHYERMRDARITLANRYEFLKMSDLTE